MSARFALLCVAWAWLALAVPAAAGERLAGRAHVLDGDTIAVSGIHVRLKGVAAPEVAHFGEPGEAGGEEAKAYMVAMVEGQTVVCDLTGERTHGRRVGWCLRRRPGRGRGADQGRAGARLPSVLGWALCCRRARSSARAAVPGYCNPASLISHDHRTDTRCFGRIASGQCQSR